MIVQQSSIQTGNKNVVNSSKIKDKPSIARTTWLLNKANQGISHRNWKLKAKGSNEKVKNIEKLKMINVVNNEKFLTKLTLVLFPIKSRNKTPRQGRKHSTNNI